MKFIIIACALMSGCALTPDLSINIPLPAENIAGTIDTHLLASGRCQRGWEILDKHEENDSLVISIRCL